MTRLLKPAWRYTLLGVISLLLLLTSTAALILGTEPGRRWLVSTAVGFAATANIQIDVDALDTPSLSSWQARRIAVSIAQQQRLLIEELDFSWSPWALLKGQVAILTLKAQQITVLLPEQAEETPETEASTTMAFSLPSIPVQVLIQELDLERVEIVNLALFPGQPNTVLKVTGSANLFTAHTPVVLDLNLVALPEQQSRLQIHSEVLSATEVRIDGQLEEATTGFLPTLLKLPNSAVNLSFVFNLESVDNELHVSLQKFDLPLLGHALQASGTFIITPRTSNIAVSELILVTDEQRHFIRGGITPADVWLQAKVRQFPLDIAKPWVPELNNGTLSGQLDVNWLFSEVGRWPTGTMNTDIVVSYNELPISAHIDGALDARILQLQSSSIKLAETTLEAKGVLDFAGPKSNITAEIQHFKTGLLHQLAVPLPTWLNGLEASTDKTRFTLSGALKTPEITATSHIVGRYQNRDFELHYEGTTTPKQARLELFDLHSEGSNLAAKGVIDWTASATNVALQFDNFQQDLLQWLPADLLAKYPKGLSFKLDGEAQVIGQLASPKVTTRLTLVGEYQQAGGALPYRLHSIGEIQTGTPNQMRLDLEQLNLALFGETVLLAEGHYRADSLDFTLDITRLPTQTLAALGWHDISGEAEANVRLQGNFAHPQLDGTVHYKNQVNLDGGGQQNLPVDLAIHFATTEGLLNVTTTYSADEQHLGTLDIQLPLAKYLKNTSTDFPLDLSVTGSMNLDIAKLFLDPELHRVEGQLTSDFKLRGSLAEPLLEGNIKLDKGLYFNGISGTQWEDITVNIAGHGETLEIVKAQSKSGDKGLVKLEGTLHWQKEARKRDDAVALTLTAKNAVFLQRRDLYGELQGKVNLHGSFKTLWLDGELDVSPLDASIDSAIKSSIPEIHVTEINEENPGKNTWMPTIHLNLTITAEQQAYLRGRGLDTELAGKITLSGTADAPQYTGLFETRRGKMDLFGKRFNLLRGEVRFSNDAVSLRIPATYSEKSGNSGENLDIQAEIYGTSDAPKLKLTSTPARPDDEILSRLIFGKSVQDISPFQAIRLAGAINTLSKGGGFDPVDSARHMLGVDSLNVENQDTENGSGLSVGIGKYINEKVYVELERSPNPAQPWQGNVQIELTPRLRLESGTGEDGGAGAELLWKKDY